MATLRIHLDTDIGGQLVLEERPGAKASRVVTAVDAAVFQAHWLAAVATL